MTDYGLNITVAYGDESVRMVGDPPFYMLGATVFGSDCEHALDTLAGLKPPSAAKLHWRDMGHRLQRRSLEIISELDCATTVAIARPLDGRRQERARRKCLEKLVLALEEAGVESLVLETRDEHLDQRDIEFVKATKASMRIGSISVVHADAASSRQLWIPDQIIGALGDTLTHVGNWEKWQTEWAKAELGVETIEVGL
ncbi:MAG TPA: hypothetical protein DCP91_02360 [Eggerthellaceae bacterium]|nr:hypothetical protein [Eggerthellaceae bacterium]